jgi:Zinc finger, C3HC4 type (RING finger)
MKSINSRRGQTSITHLMNFSLPPRPYFQQHSYHPHNHRYQRRNPTWGIGSGYHAIDKARYVHANYRFIVRPDRDYHAQSVDADVHPDWDAVLQILASAETQSASCPICLSTPIAPRMAKCGHIFCLPCLIRYMHSTDDTNPLPEKRARWKKCPICEDSIYISDTRPVRWFLGQEASMLREGGDVLLKLLARDSRSALALPRDVIDSVEVQEDIPWYQVAEVMDYARFMKGGEEYMTTQYDDEIAQLQDLEREDELMFGEDTIWTRKAVASISDAKERLAGLGNPPIPTKQPVGRMSTRSANWTQATLDGLPGTDGQLATESKASSKANSASTHSPEQASSPSSLSASNLEKLPGAISGLNIREPRITSSTLPHGSSLSRDGATSQNHSHDFYFYHALPNFFLSPLDIRILKSAFGSFSSFPSTLLPRVEHISTGHIVDDDLRKRAKYMAHLPYGCEVSFLECDWTDVISPSVLATFSNDIGRRRKRNHEKDMREERERLRAEKEEDDKRWAAARRKRPGTIEKSFSESDFQPLAHHDHTDVGSPPRDGTNMSTTPPWGAPRTHSSFATLASPGTSPDAPRTVWGTAAIPPLSPAVEPLPHLLQDHQSMDDGWLQNWELDLLDNHDAVVMVEASLSGEGSSKAPQSGGAKKKKNRKITLMSTNARRGA